MHPELPPIALLSAASLLLPLPWHWRAGNVATLSMIFWLFISNIIYGVDAIIWGSNVDILLSVWCDITTKIIIGANVALPAACFCICVHLEAVASVRMARTSINDKRKRQMTEAALCFGLPVLIMILHFIVQGHRFDIIEGYGCRPTTYFSIPGIFIIWLPPLIFALGALTFSGLALRHFMMRRLSFASHLEASRSALTTSRYLRLMMMAAIQMVWSLAVTSYSLWFTVIAVPIRVWKNWDFVHSDFGRIDQYPDFGTPQIILTTFYILWWVIPASTWIFVAFFAFGRDAVEEYKKCFVWFRRNVLRQTLDAAPKKLSFTAIKTPHLAQRLTSAKSANQNGSSLPPYTGRGSSSLEKTKVGVTSSEVDSQYDMSRHGSGVSFDYGGKSEYDDLSPTVTPSTVGPWSPQLDMVIPPFKPQYHRPHLPISPITPPPPSRPRVRGMIRNESPRSPRPITYPAYDTSLGGVIPPYVPPS